MPLHIEEMTSEVTVVEGELPLTEAQIERLVKVIMKRLEARERQARQTSEATSLRREATPPSSVK